MKKKKRKGFKYNGMVIFCSGVNFGDKSAIMVEHGCRVGVSGLLSGHAREITCKENHKKGHAATSRGNRHGAAEWQSKVAEGLILGETAQGSPENTTDCTFLVESGVRHVTENKMSQFEQGG